MMDDPFDSFLFMAALKTPGGVKLTAKQVEELAKAIRQSRKDLRKAQEAFNHLDNYIASCLV